MNAGARPTLSGRRLELPNELLLPPPCCPLPLHHPSSSNSVLWIQHLRCSVVLGFFLIALFLSHSISAEAKLHIKGLI